LLRDYLFELENNVKKKGVLQMFIYEEKVNYEEKVSVKARDFLPERSV